MQANTAGCGDSPQCGWNVLDFPLSYDAIAKEPGAAPAATARHRLCADEQDQGHLVRYTGIVSSAASAAIINTGR